MRRSRRNGQLRRVSSMRRGSHSTSSISSSVCVGFGHHHAERIGDERSAPEFQAVLGRPFEAHAIHRRHVDAVGDGVGALDGAPGIVLRRAVFRLLRRMPADGGGIEQHLRAAERGQTRGLGIPLVPANQRRNARVAGIEAAEAQVAGSEVIFFEIERVVGDVHLAIDAQQRAIGVDYQRRVVIHARRAALEDRADDHDPEFARQAREALAGGAGDRLGEVEQVGALFAAEILRAEQFLHAR